MASAFPDTRIWARLDRTKVRPPSERHARRMRASPTDAERKRWWHLQHHLGVPNSHFRRQVRLGRYIVDSACHAHRLIVEVDGGQHSLASAGDVERTNFIKGRGYRLLRFWNNDVMQNIDGVLEEIQRAITSTPTPDPSPQGGGE